MILLLWRLGDWNYPMASDDVIDTIQSYSVCPVWDGFKGETQT